jgi:hypothetical protein
MTQINLHNTALRAFLCLSRDDFERVFKLADNTLQQKNLYGISLDDADDFQQLMLYAYVGAYIAQRNIEYHLASEGFTPEKSVERSPYLLKAVNDPHGLYRLWILQKRYLRHAGHTNGTTNSSLAIEKAVKIAEWLDSRPRTFSNTVTRSRRRKKLRSKLRRFYQLFDGRHYREAHYLLYANQSVRQLASTTP